MTDSNPEFSDNVRQIAQTLSTAGSTGTEQHEALRESFHESAEKAAEISESLTSDDL